MASDYLYTIYKVWGIRRYSKYLLSKSSASIPSYNHWRPNTQKYPSLLQIQAVSAKNWYEACPRAWPAGQSKIIWKANTRRLAIKSINSCPKSWWLPKCWPWVMLTGNDEQRDHITFITLHSVMDDLCSWHVQHCGEAAWHNIAALEKPETWTMGHQRDTVTDRRGIAVLSKNKER